MKKIRANLAYLAFLSSTLLLSACPGPDMFAPGPGGYRSMPPYGAGQSSTVYQSGSPNQIHTTGMAADDESQDIKTQQVIKKTEGNGVPTEAPSVEMTPVTTE